jgi:Leucine-rich repeat (LRR) protein
MRCNPLATKKSYRAMIFTKLPFLQKLDGLSFSEKDKERVNSDSKIISVQMVMDSVKDQRKGAQIENYQEEVGEQAEEEEKPSTPDKKQDWEKNIEMVNLAHKQITIIKNLDLFNNLRKLNLMDNNIIKI